MQGVYTVQSRGIRGICHCSNKIIEAYMTIKNEPPSKYNNYIASSFTPDEKCFVRGNELGNIYLFLSLI